MPRKLFIVWFTPPEARKLGLSWLSKKLNVVVAVVERPSIELTSLTLIAPVGVVERVPAEVAILLFIFR